MVLTASASPQPQPQPQQQQQQQRQRALAEIATPRRRALFLTGVLLGLLLRFSALSVVNVDESGACANLARPSTVANAPGAIAPPDNVVVAEARPSTTRVGGVATPPALMYEQPKSGASVQASALRINADTEPSDRIAIAGTEPPLPGPAEGPSGGVVYGDSGEPDQYGHVRSARNVLAEAVETPRYWAHDLVEHADVPTNGDMVPPSFDLPPLPTPTTPINVTLWLPEECAWERYFIMSDILAHATRGGQVVPRFLKPRREPSYRRHDAHAVVTKPDWPSVMTTHGQIDDLQKCHSSIPERVQYYRPAAAFIHSDEQGAGYCPHQRLADMVPLVLRQYQHPFLPRPNALTIPLGYNGPDGYVPRPRVPKPGVRNFTWAWAGEVRHDRAQMIDVLSKAFPDEFDLHAVKNPKTQETRSKADMIASYLNAKFVPNARGFFTLDCFRLYESSRAGAIPVVRATPAQRHDVFGHFAGWEGQLPPWVYVNDWEDAPAVMQALLKDAAKLEAKQREVMAWWDRTMGAVKRALRSTLEVDVVYRQTLRAAAEAWRSAAHDATAVHETVAALLTARPSPTPATRDDRLKTPETQSRKLPAIRFPGQQ